MNHDPLCPELWRWDDGQPCMFCALITRVREDERAAALRDAKAAVETQWTDDPMWAGTNWNNALFCSREAIDALGGDRGNGGVTTAIITGPAADRIREALGGEQ